MRPAIDVFLTRAWLRRALLPLFLVVTAAIILTIALILTRITHDTIQDEALEGAEQNATTFADLIFEQEEFRGGRPTPEGLADLDRLVRTSTTISEVRVISRSGEVLYASDADRLPSQAVDTDDLKPAFAGEATSEVTSYEAERTIGDEGSVEARHPELMQANAPIGMDASGRPLAALAVYTPFASVEDDIGRTTRTTDLVLAGAALALYLLLIPTIRRASRSLSHAQDPAKALIQRRLARAIERGHLVLHYQPKIELERGRVIGVEALVRWDDPDRGLIPPDEFLPAAEDGPVIEALTLQVFELACAQHAAWREQGIDLPIAINLSARNLRDQSLPAKLDATLAEHDTTAADFTLEVTESVVMEDAEGSRRMLERLSAMGFRLSVDDFGTGHSSLVRLNRLPFDELKIDREFILGMAGGGDAAIVRAIIAVAHELKLSVVAEGVEDALTLDRLRVEDCDQIQGFYISRPVPGAALEAWLNAYPTLGLLRPTRVPDHPPLA